MRLLLLLISLFALGNAQGIHWYKTYAVALNAAKEQQKPLMLYLTRPGCGTCRYMEEEVFTDRAVRAYINNRFVAAKLHHRASDLPETLQRPMTPFYHFLDANGTEIAESILGGKRPDAFLDALQEVIDANPPPNTRINHENRSARNRLRQMCGA